MKIRNKIHIGAYALAMIPVIIVVLVIENISSRDTKIVMEQQANSHLLSVRESRKVQIETFFSNSISQINTLAKSPTIKQALDNFSTAFAAFPEIDPKNQKTEEKLKNTTQQILLNNSGA